MFPQPASALADRTTTSTSGSRLWRILTGRLCASHDPAAVIIVDQLYSQGNRALTRDAQTGPT
jgi:hypothetical protein